jgi:hypothetical protein
VVKGKKEGWKKGMKEGRKGRRKIKKTMPSIHVLQHYGLSSKRTKMK